MQALYDFDNHASVALSHDAHTLSKNKRYIVLKAFAFTQYVQRGITPFLYYQNGIINKVDSLSLICSVSEEIFILKIIVCHSNL
jgi:hypothetical protein